MVVRTSVRHGGTIEEIGKEVRERGVDLVVVTGR
jgi:nucleotide-binding universal stress UspA family protein